MNLLKPIIIMALALLSGCNHFSKTRSVQNEIWILDSRICVVADSKWKIFSHHPFGDVSDVGFRLYQSNEGKQLWYDTELRITTADLPDEYTLSAFQEGVNCKPLGAEEVDISHFNEWVIYSWKEKDGGIPHKYIEARTIFENELVCIYCKVKWPLSEDVPEGYEQRMSALQKNVISQIKVFPLPTNIPNQQVDPIVKTPVDEVEAQSTQGHP